MFSFGEIPTFKKSRGGAERYRPYEHEFPSREYNLSGGHVIIINDIFFGDVFVISSDFLSFTLLV